MPNFLPLLALLQAQAPAAAIPRDSYADSATAFVVARARAARDRNERLVTSYTANVTQRLGAGIRALSRDRMLYHQELSASIAWKRDGRSTITVTGAREGVPVAMRNDRLPGDLESSVRWLVVNPAEDYLGMIGNDEDGFVYPLRAGGERDYRFALSDSTIITLASGKRIRLLKLDITPRRADWRLMSGALWFDADSYGLVRAVFRPARPFDLRRDGDPEDVDDVPSWVNVTGDIRFITMEYGLYEDRWWMLRYAALDGIGTAGSWLGVPIKFERTYSDYEVEGGSPPPEGSSFRPAGTVRRKATDSTEVDREAIRARRDSLRAERRTCLDRARTSQERRACWRTRRLDDSVLAVVVPSDTAALVTSPTLGPPILDMGGLISGSELRGLADAIGELPKAPLGSQLQLPRGVGALLQHARYNRVEALSLGLAGRFQHGSLILDASGRIGLADGVPNGELGIGLAGRDSRFRIAGYRRLAAMNRDTRPFGAVNSLWGLLAQRDDGEYFRTSGVELTGEEGASGWWRWRVFAERQRPAEVETSFSLPHLLDASRAFRPNTVAERADAFGAELSFRASRPLSRTVQLGGDVSLGATGGDFQFGGASATGRLIVTPKTLLALALELSAGTSTGTVPVQGRYYLGGATTLRGYDGAVTAGEAFWRGRLEAGNSFPAARITVFTDVGWAGERTRFWQGRPLIGSGVGASFFDGLIRLDVARGLRAPTGWRFDLYFDGRL